MHLVELIAAPATQSAGARRAGDVPDAATLGKGVVRAKDTPNFIANRVGVFGMLATMREAEKYGLPFDVVDDLTGTRLGRAKSATFRTADVVGLDTMAHVIKHHAGGAAGLARSVRGAVCRAAGGAGAGRAAARWGRRAGRAFTARKAAAIKVLDPKQRTSTWTAPARPTSCSARILKTPGCGRAPEAAARNRPSAGALPVGDLPRRVPLHRRAPGASGRHGARYRFRAALGFRLGAGPVRDLAAGRLAAHRRVGAARTSSTARRCATRRCRSGCFKGPVARAGGVHTPQGSWNRGPGALRAARRSAGVCQAAFPRAFGRRGRRPSGDDAGATVFADESCRLWRFDRPTWATC